MTFVTLRDLNTDDTVLGQDWQDVRDNFEFLKVSNYQYGYVAGAIAATGASWQWTHDIVLKFVFSSLGTLATVYCGGLAQGYGAYKDIYFRLMVGGVAHEVEVWPRMAQQWNRQSWGFSYPFPLLAGDHEIGLQHYVTVGPVELRHLYLAVREL